MPIVSGPDYHFQTPVSPTPTDPHIGRTISQYDVVAKLGGGGMGVVYKATDTKLGRTVALKFLPPQWSHDESAKQRFLREAQAASATNHRNICVIHDIDQTDDGQLFIVMAYYEGQTLKQKLDAGPLPVAEAIEIATEIAEGLAKAHSLGVVHRDIKPGNLIVTDDGVKVLDFGLAKFADAVKLTLEGSTIGTAAYMSPEQVRGDEADARSDIWALGVVMYEMLTGEVPFKGGYAEAIFHAIKFEPLPSLARTDRDIPEVLERIVMRTLEKDPAGRYQSARELARDLRLLQGRTVPLDLRTEALPAMAGARLPELTFWQRVRREVTIGRAAAAVLVLAAAGAGSYRYVTRPVVRIPVTIAPVVNQTGDTTLDPFRLALTQALLAELGDSPNARVLPYDRVLQIVRGFLQKGTDVSSREAVQALTTQSGAQSVIIPTLLYENGSWRARAEFRNPETSTNTAVFETSPVVSSLSKDTAYALMASLGEGIQQHFKADGPGRSYVPRAPAARLRTLDAVAVFEQGLNAYEQMEFATARTAFQHATELDSQNPLVFAWLSRADMLLRQDAAARQAGDQASKLVTPQTPVTDALFVAAVAAEAQRDVPTGETRYRNLTARFPDEPMWLNELASFQDRRTSATDAIATYRRALTLDSRLARPHLELCRLYNRVNESASAKQDGNAALSAYRAIGNRGGEAQALMCLSDELRLGSDDERAEARRDADAAVTAFQQLGYQYNLARAQYYVALTAEAVGHPSESVAVYERSLTSARESGNVVLEPLLLMNLGAMQQKLGNRVRALDYYRQSQGLFEQSGDELRAAQNQADIAAILIEYGGQSDEGLRNIRNALGVFQKVGDKHWEAFAAKVIAASYRYTGQQAEAEHELNRAVAVVKERDLKSEIAALTIDLAQVRFDMSDYAGARTLLVGALRDASGKDGTQARIGLGLTDVRLGKFDAAQAELRQASRDIEARGDNGQLPLLHEAMGELAYEAGRPGEARMRFSDAAALWTDDLPDAASVEARAYLGLLDALDGKTARGREAVQVSLDQARKMGAFALEARCRLHLARIDVAALKPDAAVNTLIAIPTDRENTLGLELQAQVHHWRSVAMKARGDGQGAQSEETIARGLLQTLRGSLPEPDRDGFMARPSIHLLGG